MGRKRKELISQKPHITGRVWSMATIDFPKPTGTPYFTFGLHVEHFDPATPESEWPVLYFDLTKQGAATVASVVAAAYVAKTELDVFLEDQENKFVKWIQASKPPK
jgi:hypothetical protein